MSKQNNWVEIVAIILSIDGNLFNNELSSYAILFQITTVNNNQQSTVTKITK